MLYRLLAIICSYTASRYSLTDVGADERYVIMQSNLITVFEKHLQEEQLLAEGDSIVVAVSGGPDSMALLHLLFLLAPAWRLQLIVAHVNHGFRGEESDREAELVKEVAAAWGLPCEVGTFHVPSYIEETGENPQAAARTIRYGFLGEVARRYQASRIALAHHADDQAETVLMRIVRGTGPSGLAGIPVRRNLLTDVELVRPLLRIYKEELLAYCEAYGLSYCVDSSNAELKYARNQFRLEVLPFLEQYNGRISEGLSRLAEVMSAENAYLDQESLSLLERFVTVEEGRYTWSAKWFAAVPLALQRRMIKLILSYLSFDSVSMDFLSVERVRTVALKQEPANVRQTVFSNIVLTREYDRMALHRMVLPPSPYAYTLHRGQTDLFIEETGVRLLCRWGEARPKAEELGIRTAAWFDADALSFPLVVRSRRNGDRMQVSGLNGSKKVKDMFIDGKIPPSVRERVPVITDASGELLWLAGVRRSSGVEVTDRTEHVLQMILLMPQGSPQDGMGDHDS
jgi:tRNA(Ile)-lysidine synthase